MERKVDALEDKFDDLSLETKAIYKIIEIQAEKYKKRIVLPEQETGVN